MQKNTKWLPLDVAAQQFGYAHKQSLTRRLRQLRQAGHVIDIGRPPKPYQTQQPTENQPIVLMWPNPKIALLRSDAPKKLLQSRPGKRAKI